MTNLQHVALVGVMGCGKTTIGKLLAQRLCIIDFFDSDQVIVDLLKTSIRTIFQGYTESFFRTQEYVIIRSVVNNTTQCILSTGGGAFIYPYTYKLLQQNCQTIWLKVDYDTLLYRLANDETRPLLNGQNKLYTLFKDRQEIYEKARIHVDTTDKSLSYIVDELRSKLSM